MRKWIPSMAMAVAALNALPGVVLASSAEGGEANPVSLDLWQSAFTILVFVLLVVILSRTAYGAILDGLQKRERFIRESLDAAEEARKAAETHMHEYEEKLRKAREEASAIVEEGRRDAEVVRRRIEDEAHESCENMLQRARREIEIGRDTALKALYEETANLAASLAVSALNRQMSPEEHQRLVMDALRDLGQRQSSVN
ncbi:MAG: F0F1 ATP synthase subunit B [Phycisphaerae bacterium]|nr:F0F1 ATP synthase subunit B [Phycisphaerae bacterium]